MLTLHICHASRRSSKAALSNSLPGSSICHYIFLSRPAFVKQHCTTLCPVQGPLKFFRLPVIRVQSVLISFQANMFLVLNRVLDDGERRSPYRADKVTAGPERGKFPLEHGNSCRTSRDERPFMRRTGR